MVNKLQFIIVALAALGAVAGAAYPILNPDICNCAVGLWAPFGAIVALMPFVLGALAYARIRPAQLGS